MPEPDEDIQAEDAANLPTTRGAISNFNDEEIRVRNIVSAVISARQATNLENLENRVSQLIEEKIGSAMNNLLAQLNINAQDPTLANNVSPVENNYQRSTNIIIIIILRLIDQDKRQIYQILHSRIFVDR